MTILDPRQRRCMDEALQLVGACAHDDMKAAGEIMRNMAEPATVMIALAGLVSELMSALSTLSGVPATEFMRSLNEE